MGGIRVAQGTVTRICDAGDSFAIQIQSANDINAALAAGRLARVDLLGLASQAGMTGHHEGPAERASVSAVVHVPGGPLLLVEHLDADYHLLRTIPDVVRHRLEQAGVQDATIASPEPGGVLDDLDHTAHAVVLRLFPPPAGPTTVLPPDWIDIA